VRIVDPVCFSDIVPFLNRYDLGLYILPPRNLNLKHALPNKLFEFIQARLGVAIGPSIEMRKIVEEFDCGVVASDFTPKSLAVKLNALDGNQVGYYKNQADRAAGIMNIEKTRKRILSIIEDM
jgi:hypothetical protein